MPGAIAQSGWSAPAWVAGEGRKESSFSEEKEAKRLLFPVPCQNMAGAFELLLAHHQEQKSFCFFFFRKRRILP
jgi:hypothetical protein